MEELKLEIESKQHLDRSLICYELLSRIDGVDSIEEIKSIIRNIASNEANLRIQKEGQLRLVK